MLKVGNKEIGCEQPVFIVAEIGINHNGNLEIAMKLVDLAVMAGCDAVKFQKRTVPIVYTAQELAKPRQVARDVLKNAISRGVLSAEAVKRLTDSDFENSTNGDLKWALEFMLEEYRKIDQYCRQKGILWFASPWDEDSVDFLEEFNPPCYKVASPSLTDDGLLRHIRAKGRPIILSTGMSDLPMIKHAVDVLGLSELVLLHCTSVYPQGLYESEKALRMLNLSGIAMLQKNFPSVPIGFSSNDNGIMPAYATVAMGACVLEKHITLKRSIWGSDQASSCEPQELMNLCRWIRELQIAKGDGEIRLYPEEIEVMKKLRRKTWQL